MLVIGVTGGIGSGKSLVTKILKEAFGAAVIETDKIAHGLMKKGALAYQKILECFGEEILGEEREIDRKKLGALVFRKKEKLETLNALVHPLVEEEVDRMLSELKKRRYPYAAIETALLIEAGYQRKCGVVWYVYADEATRKTRLKRDRNMEIEKAEAIFSSQKSDAEYRMIADFVINNAGDEADTRKQIEEILRSYQGR